MGQEDYLKTQSYSFVVGVVMCLGAMTSCGDNIHPGAPTDGSSIDTAVGVADAVSSVGGNNAWRFTITDSVGVVDGLTADAIHAFTVTFTDAVGIADSVSTSGTAGITYTATITDTVGAVDSVSTSGTYAFVVVLTDNVGITDPQPNSVGGLAVLRSIRFVTPSIVETWPVGDRFWDRGFNSVPRGITVVNTAGVFTEHRFLTPEQIDVVAQHIYQY